MHRLPAARWYQSENPHSGDPKLFSYETNHLYYHLIHQAPPGWSPRYSEKIFVHTDKEFYLAGEILWFKYMQWMRLPTDPPA